MDIDLSQECPRLITELQKLLQAESLKGDKEALIYALAQVLHDRIRDSELEAEEKGATVSNIVGALKDLHKEDICLYHERLRYLVEQKDSTIH